MKYCNDISEEECVSYGKHTCGACPAVDAATPNPLLAMLAVPVPSPITIAAQAPGEVRCKDCIHPDNCRVLDGVGPCAKFRGREATPTTQPPKEWTVPTLDILRARHGAYLEASAQVNTHWNATNTMVNQKEQAERSAYVLSQKAWEIEKEIKCLERAL